MNVCIYMYICIERERERKKKRAIVRLYTYVYMCMVLGSLGIGASVENPCDSRVGFEVGLLVAS